MKRRLMEDEDDSNRNGAEVSKKQTTRSTTLQDSHPPEQEFHKNTMVEEEQDEYDSDQDNDEYSYHSSSSTCSQNDAPETAISLAIDQEGFCFCNKTQAKSMMDATIQEVSEVLGVSSQAAVVLLRHYQWNTKRLTQDYFGNKRDKIQTACGVYHRCCQTTMAPRDESITSTITATTCAICMDSVEDVFSEMPCGHATVCKECWVAFLQEALQRGPACVYTTCPSNASCGEIVTELEVQQLLDSSLFEKFQQFQFTSCIDSNERMQWCPGTNCESVLVGSATQEWQGEGSCPSCTTRFCFACGSLPHSPASCAMLELWETKCSNDSETANWMLCKTKKCPKCETRIHKNGGCNHMTCSQCKFHFCWLCMQDWKVHGYERSCNEMDLTKARSTDSTRAQAERELERYLFCFQRFQNHNQGQEFAHKQLQEFIEKKESKESMNASFDWNALEQALRQLVECRRVLKYTYVVTYNLGGEEENALQRQLFQDHQGLLERFTEQLSEITEMEYEKMERLTLVNLTKTVEKYTVGVMECLDAQENEEENDA